MYGSQVWGPGFLQAGREFSSPLSTLHLHSLKGTLGVKQSTTNWAVLQNVDMNRCNSTGFGQLSSFSIVCLIRQKKLPSVEVRLKRLKSTEGFSTCCAIAQRLISTATPVDFNRSMN